MFSKGVTYINLDKLLINITKNSHIIFENKLNSKYYATIRV
jgi:hypothetical protein